MKRMTVREWNLAQMVEALGCDNRLYFFLKNRREAYSDDELIRYYIDNGGALDFAIKHQKEKPHGPSRMGEGDVEQPEEEAT